MRISLPLLAIAPLLASTALFAACGGGTVTGVDEPTPDAGTGNGSSSSSSSSGGSSSGDPAPFGLPSIDALPKDKFSFLKPAGDTICALGGEYGFAIRPGDPSKVVVEFEGGGACWNEGTCDGPASEKGPAVRYKDFVDGTHYTDDTQIGLRNHENDANPIQGWTHVVVPYCSADVHWGDKQSTYGDRVIQHRGAKNTGAVLEYVYSQLKAPERLFVTGCSAGGYGASYHTAAIRAHYTNAAIRHFSDSAAGVIPSTYFETLSNAWGFLSTFPTDIGSAADFKTLAYLYEGIAAKYPDVRLSQYNTLTDSTQAGFLALMGGDDWRGGMKANIATLVSNIPDFRHYMSEGNVHCIIDDNAFYEKEVNGTKLTTWLGNMVDDEPIENVRCADCGTDP